MGGSHFVVSVILVIILAALAAWFLAMPWLVRGERRRQRRKAQSGTIGVFDELFNPASHQARIIWEAQTELPAPARGHTG